jgi:gluconate 5-dehydrogenase
MSDEPTIQELFDLTGKSALITGATGWLGSSMARALAEAGASVIISSRDAGRAKDAATELPSPGGATHEGVELDQTDPDSIDRGFASAATSAGKLDILVNNGLDPVGHDLTDCTYEEFLDHQRNTTAYFVLARLLCNHIVERKATGSIINLGSMYGQVASYPDAYAGVATASPVAYHAHKGGVIHMTRHLAAYYAEHGVRVNCISPGPFPKDETNPEMVSRLCEKLPMKRMGRPHELKGTLLLLASDAGSYITGQNITVDGGWMAW